MFGEDLASAYVLCHQASTVLEFWARDRQGFGGLDEKFEGTINVDFRLRNIHEVQNVYISE